MTECQVCDDPKPHCYRCGGNHPTTTRDNDSEHLHKWQQRWGHVSGEGPKPELVVEISGGVLERVFHYYPPFKGLPALDEEVESYTLLDWDNINESDRDELEDNEGVEIAREVYPDQMKRVDRENDRLNAEHEPPEEC